MNLNLSFIVFHYRNICCLSLRQVLHNIIMSIYIDNDHLYYSIIKIDLQRMVLDFN